MHGEHWREQLTKRQDRISLIKKHISLSDACIHTVLRGKLPGLNIRLEALDKANLLERAVDRTAVVGRLALAFGALRDFASDTSLSRGNFYQWCKNSNHPSVLSLEMIAGTESKTVRRNPALLDTRLFAVDPRVHESGWIEMMAHIKLGKGQLAPRLHYHDDTRGRTGLVHIGYIGPHLPTARAT